MLKVRTPAIYSERTWNEEFRTFVNEEKEIKVGQGCTVSVGSDAYPYHVSRVSDSGKTVWIKRADYQATPDYDYYTNQKYIITPNPNSPEEMVRMRKVWGWTTSSGSRVTFSSCHAYQDPHF